MNNHCHCSNTFALFCLIISYISVGCHAFISTPTNSKIARTSSILSATSNEINRRKLICDSATNIAGVVTASSFIGPAHAATATASKSQSVAKSLCDPSVSTWTKSFDNSQRTVHILGTAHISSASAELAGRLVREVQPNVVFVELDVKRVKRAIPGLSSGEKTDTGKTAVSEANINSNQSNEQTGTSSRIAAFSSTPTSSDQSDSMQSPIIDIGSKYVGSAVKNMYGKLESEGFKAGDEFATSVREGLAIGSTIVLGDRDVEVTLRRLTKALSKTDIRKLLSADSEVEKSMEELLPENLKAQMMKKQVDQGGGVGGNIGKMVKEQSRRDETLIGSSKESSMNVSSIEVDKAEFQMFVETMKEKDNVKKIMGALQKSAPEVYEAMVAERDVYMGKGLDELGFNLNSDARDTVAVMGMAHVDGVERYLLSQGWEAKRYPCPALR